MAGVDSILRIVVENGADELRLGTDEPPRMLRRGGPLKLSIPTTTDLMLRHLLSPLLTDEVEAALRGGAKVERTYRPDGGEPFRVTLSPRAGRRGMDAVFLRASAMPAHAPAPREADRSAPEPAAPVALPSPAPSEAAAPLPAFAAAPGSLGELLAQAAALRASDLHLCAGEAPTVRVDGALRPLGEAPAAMEALLGPLLDAPARAALDEGRGVDRAFDTESGERCRVHLYRAAPGLAAAIRLLPRSAPRLGELRLPVPLDLLDELTALPHGLVLVCGPTGSGKSATLAALAQHALHSRPRVVITLEDPIEYHLLPGDGLVRQRQVGRDARDFPTALRDALREDPDLLLLGELRDPETIALALTAAETGHLVLASMHSRSAPSSVERIVDSMPAPRQQQVRVQLADSLRAVIAQRLVPRASGAGRVPAVEVLRGSSNVANLIREGKTAQLATAIQSGRKEGMVPLERTLADLVRAGHVRREAAEEVANDLGALAALLAG